VFNGSSTLEQLEKIIEFTGYPTNEDINSLDSDLAKTMIVETKLESEKEGLMKTVLSDVETDVQDLIKGIMQFNPKKLMTIEAILAHPLLKDFRKVEEEKTCSSEIKTDIDDNRKLSVENYRNLLYKVNRSESKRETPTKYKKPTSATTCISNSRSDKKVGEALAKNKSSDSIKPSSTLAQSKPNSNALKVNKSS
jgi:serine/threonine protein kinase